MFLIHRVELKVKHKMKKKTKNRLVSNSPCGVESACFGFGFVTFFVFLIHRVELKALIKRCANA